MTDSRITRRAAAAAEIAAAGVDALLLVHLPNIRWLTGFTGTAAQVVLTAQGDAILITDFRYEVQAPAEVGNAAEVVIDRVNVRERLKKVVESLGVTTLAIESHVMTVNESERLNKLLNVRTVPVVDLIENLRQVKDAGEVHAIRAAADLAHEALGKILPNIRVGDSELAIAAQLEAELRRLGSEWHPFQTIVASGPRSALPHARSSERRIAKGEFLLIDYGAKVDGYCSDITRTFVVGAQPDDQQREIYRVVGEAQQRAREGMRAGMSGRQADSLAREVIAGQGYGDAFGHSLGHGVGLEVHEMPRLASTVDAQLPLGAVVTVEPGIYLSGWGGVRLEDDVWLSAGGPVLLSNGKTDLIVLDA